MHIEKNRVVTLNYTLRDEQGTVLDASSGRGPLSYLHGKGNIGAKPKAEVVADIFSAIKE